MEGREGRLGEMRKRKRDDLESVATSAPGTSMGASTPPKDEDANQSEDDDFEGFSSDDETEPQTEASGQPSNPASDTTEDMIPLDDSSEEEEAGDESDSDELSGDDSVELDGGLSDGDLEDLGDASELEEVPKNVRRSKRQKKAT